MNDTSKLLLTVVIGGTVLGLGLSSHTSPTMNRAAASDWRDRYRSSYGGDAVQFVDAGPIDLSPAQPWPGAPFGLYSAMTQAPADYGPTYEDNYAAADPVSSQPVGELADADSFDPGASDPAEDAGREASATAASLKQATDQPAPYPAASSKQLSSQDSFGSANASATLGPSNAL